MMSSERRSLPRRLESLSGLSLAVLVFAPFAAGHFLSYVLRSINAVLAPILAETLHFDAWQIGVLTSAYFLAFGIAQLPVGIALDRFGPRKVQITLLVVAAGGCALFAISSTFPALVLARLLIGAGLAACFMAAIKAISDWVPPARLPSIHGFMLAVGGLGAMASTLPVEMANQLIGWRALFWLFGVSILLTGVGIYLLTPIPLRENHREPATWRSFVEVYKNPFFLRTIRLVLIPHTVYFAVQGLWIGNWLHDAARLSPRETASFLFAGMAAIVIGTITAGNIGQYLGARGVSLLDVTGYGIAGFVVVQLILAFNITALAPVVALAFPLLGAVTGLEFTVVAQSVPPSMTGRASTALNLLIFLGSFVVQAGFGAIIGLWQPDANGSYPAAAYSVAFTVLLTIQLPGIMLWFVEKRARRGSGREGYREAGFGR
jgi:MFS family permease